MPDTLTIGIDIGGTNIRAGVVTTTGAVLATEAVATARSPHAAAAQIETLVRALDRPGVAGLGLGIPGRVDARKRTIFSGGFVDLSTADLPGRLEKTFGRRVTIENDGTMALIAEAAVGCARGLSDVAMFTIGTGIGGAVMTGGHILHGAASAGQLGHLTVNTDGRECLCGRRGCLETESSGTALGRHIAQAGLPAGSRIEDLLAATATDANAARVVDAWARPLRCAIDSIAAALAPQLVVIGGGLGIAACAALARHPALSPWYQSRVSGAALGDRSGVIGAGLAAHAYLGRAP